MALFQSKNLWIKQLTDGVAVLMLDRDQQSTNFLDLAMLDELDRALDAVVQAESIRLLVIRSGKTANFCHGPSTAQIATWKKDDFLSWTERGQRLCNKLADMPIPSACVITGTCFDAGLELALACDYRVVVNRSSTSLGFPELEWGMIPCWGGTQRLPHLVGLDNSLSMLFTGRCLDARAAWLDRLADDLAEEDGDEAPSFLASPVKRDWAAYPRRTWRERWLESNRLGRWFLLRGAERILRKRIPDELPAPGLMLQALRHVYRQTDMQPGLEFERQAIERVAEHPALRELLRLLHHRDTLRLHSLPASEKSRIRQVGVIGGGTTALALLLHSITRGYEVVLRTHDEESLGAALSQIVQRLQLEVQSGGITSNVFQKMLGAIRGTYTWTHFENLHLVVDATEGTLSEKRQFYQEMEKRIPHAAVVVPLTFMHRVADLREGLQRPERLIGLHVIEPWSRGSLAEVVAPVSAAQNNVNRVRDWAVALGKGCLQVPDCVGGVAMRVWMPALNEAGLLVKEGVPIDRIDRAMRRFGMTHGPLEWMDLVGIDQIAGLASAIQPLFAGRIAFESGFALMAEKQWLGKQTGTGFYMHSSRKPRPHGDAVQLWHNQGQGETPRPVPTLSEPDTLAWIQRRLVTLMSLEAVRCLDEGLAKNADDLDCALCLTGWATHRGGPLGHARHLGTEALTARCTELASEYGPRFAPVTTMVEYLNR